MLNIFHNVSNAVRLKYLDCLALEPTGCNTRAAMISHQCTKEEIYFCCSFFADAGKRKQVFIFQVYFFIRPCSNSVKYHRLSNAIDSGKLRASTSAQFEKPQGLCRVVSLGKLRLAEQSVRLLFGLTEVVRVVVK